MKYVIAVSILAGCVFGQTASSTFTPVPVEPPASAGVRTLVFTVTLKPESLTASRSIFGKGRDVGKWGVTVCNENAVTASIERVRILDHADAIHEIVGHEAEDVILRKAASDPRSLRALASDKVLTLGSTGLAVAGIVGGNPSLGYAGLAIGFAQFLVDLLKSHVPNPQPYIVDMLPAEITLPPGKCNSATPFYVISSLTHNPQTIRLRIEVPDYGAGR